LLAQPEGSAESGARLFLQFLQCCPGSVRIAKSPPLPTLISMQWRESSWVFCLLVWVVTSCRQVPVSEQPSSLQRFEFEQPQMGVPFRMVVYAADEDHATRAATAAFDRVKQLNTIMSDYESESELNELSRSAGQGRAVRVSPDLWHVLEASQRLASQTKGAFDITVGPYVSACGAGRGASENCPIQNSSPRFVRQWATAI
jgi:thiamine biosynthesis lipoprotein ApbE